MNNSNIKNAVNRAEHKLKAKMLNAVTRILTGNEDSDLVKTLLIKPVGDYCNLRCTYCYEAEHNKKEILSLNSLKNLYIELSKRKETTINLAWHGGEPLLAGIEYYRDAFEMQKKYLHNKNVSNVIQTSGYLINKKWVALFKIYNVRVGISLDGDREHHDKYRLTITGKGTFDRIVDSINLMNQEDLDFGVITVIGDNNPAHLLRLCKELSIKNIDIHPRNSTGMNDVTDEASTTAKELQEFLIELFDLWAASTAPIVISVFEEFYSHYVGASPSVCHFNGHCSSILAIDNNGDVLPCTRPFSGKYKKLGNLKDHKYDIGEIEATKLYSDFIRQDRDSRDRVKECKWYRLCNNGCPQHRESNAKQDVAGADKYCQCSNGGLGGYYHLWEHMALKTPQILSRT